MENKEIQDIKEAFMPGNEKIEGWTGLKLYFGEYSKEDGPILCVGIQSKLLAREAVYFLETDLVFRRNKVKELLSKKGVICDITFRQIENNVQDMKKAEQYQIVKSIDELLNSSRPINQKESDRKIMGYYEMLRKEALLVEQESYESSKCIKGIQIQRKGKKEGYDRKRDFGEDVIIVSSEQLADILDIQNEKKVVSIVKSWIEKELVITNSTPSLTVRVSWGNGTRSRGYVVRLNQGGVK